MIIKIGRLTLNIGNTYTFKLYIGKTGHTYLAATPKTGPAWEIHLPRASDPFKAVAKACAIFVTIQEEKGAAMFDTAHASSICQEPYGIWRRAFHIRGIL